MPMPSRIMMPEPISISLISPVHRVSLGNSPLSRPFPQGQRKSTPFNGTSPTTVAIVQLARAQHDAALPRKVVAAVNDATPRRLLCRGGTPPANRSIARRRACWCGLLGLAACGNVVTDRRRPGDCDPTARPTRLQSCPHRVAQVVALLLPATTGGSLVDRWTSISRQQKRCGPPSYSMLVNDEFQVWSVNVARLRLHPASSARAEPATRL